MDDYTCRIAEFEKTTSEHNSSSEKLDAELRDVGKKVQRYDTAIEETLEKLQLSSSKLEEAEKEFKEKDDDVSTMSRRIMLIEEEGRINEEKMANTVLKLAAMSKDADNIVKGCRFWESKVMNNEVSQKRKYTIIFFMTFHKYQVDLEDLDNNLRDAKKMCKF